MNNKLSEKEIENISNEKLKRIERYNQSYEKKEYAEARKEFCKQLRYIFEKAPPETIPFLVYCIYVGAAGLFGFLYIVIKFKGTSLYITLALLIFTMILPIIILPKFSIKGLFSWIGQFKKSKKKTPTNHL